jgi:hypothetical protein
LLSLGASFRGFLRSVFPVLGALFSFPVLFVADLDWLEGGALVAPEGFEASLEGAVFGLAVDDAGFEAACGLAWFD